MNLKNPYEKKYLPISILTGLKFYYELLDKVNIEIYLKENFPIKRKDVEIAIHFLSNLPENAYVTKIAFSHPQLTLAMESIEYYSTISDKELHNNKTRIYLFLSHILDTSINLMNLNAKYEIPKTIQHLSINEKITYLIENKYYYTQNEGSFPTKFIAETVAYCESQIAKYKEIKSSEESDPISMEVRKMMESYFLLVKNNIENNDLISPLIQKNFDAFIYKLKAMLYIPSYFDIKKNDKEHMFHIYLLGILKGKIEAYEVRSNKESGIGRYDIILSPVENKNPGVIIEIKKVETSTNIENELNGALSQIQSKNYNNDLKTSGVTIILNVAIVFQGLEPHIKYQIT